jgi:hypothetical protein
METPEPRSRPTVFPRLALLVGFGIVSSVATGCSPATSSPLLPSASPGLPYSTLAGVNCADANDCWAVGYTGFAGIATSNTLIEHYAGSSWAIVSTPRPIEGQLNGVTCVSAGDCWAVGESDSSDCTSSSSICSNGPPLIEHYSGDGWAIVSSPNPGAGMLFGVTCVSATDCWAVGSGYLTDNPLLIEHYAGSGWAMAASVQFTNGLLYEVACVSAGDCWAVGSTSDQISVGGSTPGTHDAQPLVARYTGSGWAIVSTPNRGPGQLNGVTCAGGGGCWAVGSLSAASSPPLIEHDMGTGWAISTPDPSPGDLADVACPSVGECWAVGSSVLSSKPVIERYAGSRWAVVSNAAPNAAPGTGSGVLGAVTCADANDCWAVGNSGDLASGGQTLIEHYSGSSWTIFGRQ